MMRGHEREKCVIGCWDVVQHVKISGNIILVLGETTFCLTPRFHFSARPMRFGSRVPSEINEGLGRHRTCTRQVVT